MGTHTSKRVSNMSGVLYGEGAEVKVGVEIYANYGLVLIAALANSILLTLLHMRIGIVRRRVLDSAYVERHLQEENEVLKRMGQAAIGPACEPDPGTGRLIQHLPIDAWMELNIAQRTADNFLQSHTQFQLWLLFSGLFLPRTSAFFGMMHFFGRILYSRGFKNRRKGPNARSPGFIIAFGSSMMLLLGVIYGVIRMFLKYLFWNVV